ncbi:hypothetical protein CAPN009_17400 [Capnocytophaga canimorsus]|nr:hypothetical protein CAPN009_17400 [Capnocytophaga canimorsus]
MSQGFWAKNDLSLNKKMPKSEIPTSRKRVYVDCKPAELKINTDWLIVYLYMKEFIFHLNILD